jgi:hypothetical protein
MSSLTFYADESGTDSNSAVAVVGGLLLSPKGYFWLNMEWRHVQEKYGISTPIHMREFGSDRALGTVPAAARRCLLAELVRVINENKVASVAATLDSSAYKRVFQGITKLSMYAACFAQLVMMNDAEASLSAHSECISYVLDRGNNHRSHLLEAQRQLAPRWPSLASIDFADDSSSCALQAADVVAWSVRRKLAGGFPSGYEALQALFDRHHRDLPYHEEWMVGVADLIRGAQV